MLKVALRKSSDWLPKQNPKRLTAGDRWQYREKGRLSRTANGKTEVSASCIHSFTSHLVYPAKTEQIKGNDFESIIIK
jgi:hypothetical protein